MMAFVFFLEMPQNQWITFSVLFCLKNKSRDFSSKCPTFSFPKTLKCPIFLSDFECAEMPYFRHFQNEIGKLGISRLSEMKMWGISRKYHVINYKMGKEPKMNVFYFGAFQRKMQMPSSDKVGCIFPVVISSDFPMEQHRDDDRPEDAPHFKYLIDMLSGAFHGTSCTKFLPFFLVLKIRKNTK